MENKMSVILELEPELENAVRAEAERTGQTESDLLLTVLNERFSEEAIHLRRFSNRLSEFETALFEKINIGIPEEMWLRYDQLTLKRRAESLSPGEHSELIDLNETIETIHSTRLLSVAELAKFRGIPLLEMMQQLGIKPRDVHYEDY